MASVVRSLHFMATFWPSGVWLCIECDRTLPLVESMYFDETGDEKAAKKVKREEKVRAKAKAVEAEKVWLGKRWRTDGMCEGNHPATYLKCKRNKDGNLEWTTWMSWARACVIMMSEPIILLKTEVSRSHSRGWLIVYLCKTPAVVEGYKKIRVAFFKINDWINDCICHLNLIFCRWNKYIKM